MSTQLGLIFVDIQAMRNEVNRVLIHQPRFTVDEALHVRTTLTIITVVY